MSVGQIIEGHVNELLGKHKDLSERRLEICLRCPICKMTIAGPICDNSKYINKNDEVSDKPKIGYVRGCSCRLNSKTTLKNMHCDAGKW